MLTRAMLSRLLLATGLLAICAFAASARRTPNLRNEPPVSVAVALATGDR